MKRIFPACLASAIFLLNGVAVAQNRKATAESVQLSEHVYKIVLNHMVNVIALVGPDGVLLVDSGFDGNPSFGYANSPEAVRDELRRLANDDIRYIIDTHTDIDHAYGNAELGRKATIIAQRLGRERLARMAQFPKEGLPNVTFEDSLHVYFNNEEVDLYHLPGHTDHDVVVHLKNAKIVCLGDLVIPDSFGSISRTGNARSMIKAIDFVLDRLPDDVTIVAGHDRTMKKDELKTYKDMIEKTLAIVVQAIDMGLSLEAMQNEDILKDWKSWNGVLFKELDANTWISMIYMSIIRTLKPSAAEKVAELLKSTDFSGADSEIRTLVTRKAGYYFLEMEFNLLGYTLINEGRLNDAIGVFKITTELYPESWNAYDSLGEAHMKAGNKKLAIRNYEKSLKLKPDSQSGIDALKQLRGKSGK